jgi:hypothetical protein
MVIFNSYVKLPEGNIANLNGVTPPSTKFQLVIWVGIRPHCRHTEMTNGLWAHGGSPLSEVATETVSAAAEMVKIVIFPIKIAIHWRVPVYPLFFGQARITLSVVYPIVVSP